jgi:hypothetical protein
MFYTHIRLAYVRAGHMGLKRIFFALFCKGEVRGSAKNMNASLCLHTGAYPQDIIY